MDIKIIDSQVYENTKALKSFLAGTDFSKFYQEYANSSDANDRLAAVCYLLDIISTVITPNSACRDKCSHCCYQPVFISIPEMVQISMYTNLPPLENASIVDVESIYATQNKYLDTKCPFLINSRCSIYPVRPLLCRLYFNLSHISDLCKGVYVDGKEVEVPILDYEFLMPIFDEFLNNVLFDIHQYYDLLRG